MSKTDNIWKYKYSKSFRYQMNTRLQKHWDFATRIIFKTIKQNYPTFMNWLNRLTFVLSRHFLSKHNKVVTTLLINPQTHIQANDQDIFSHADANSYWSSTQSCFCTVHANILVIWNHDVAPSRFSPKEVINTFIQQLCCLLTKQNQQSHICLKMHRLDY